MIATLSRNSAEVGDLRHCLASGIKMLDALYDQARANLCASLNRATGAAGRPPVVAYPFDKQTHGRRAIHMIGGTTFVVQRLWPAYFETTLAGTEIAGGEPLMRVRDVVSQQSPMTKGSTAVSIRPPARRDAPVAPTWCCAGAATRCIFRGIATAARK